MSEQAWVNGSKGNDGWIFLDTDSEHTTDIEEAAKHGTTIEAQHAAQTHAHRAGLEGRGFVYWHAVAVEREWKISPTHESYRWSVTAGGPPPWPEELATAQRAE